MDRRIKSGGDEIKRLSCHSSGAESRRENEMLYPSSSSRGSDSARASHIVMVPGGS